MPTDYDEEWEEEPSTEEDAIKRVIKRIDRLNKRVLGDLWKVSQRCRKELYEEGKVEEHTPQCFVRYEEGDNEETRECFHICKKCISDYLIAHPEAMDDITILRGEPTKELKEFMRKRAEEEYKKEEARRMADEDHIKKVLESDQPCPVCGKPFNKHTEDNLKSCYKQYADTNPPDEEGGTNKA